MPDPIPATQGLFATPIYRVLAGHGLELTKINDYILARETDEYRHPDSPQTAHSAVFESRFDFFSWQDDEVKELKNRLFSHLMNYLADINGFNDDSLKQLKFRNESWFHITRQGGYFQPHTHPLASVSMIYCVSPGDEEVSNSREAGQVMFTDPRHNASMYLDPANRYLRREFSFNSLLFRLQADELCIFPSYVQHNVEPYYGEHPRITIAANFSFSLK